MTDNPRNYLTVFPKKALFLCSFSILLLFLGFFTNYWQVVEAGQRWLDFDNYQRDSESLIIGRMVKSGQDGIFSAGGLTGSVILDAIPAATPEEDKTIDNQYLAYTNDLPFVAYSTYDSQNGGQGMLFSILDKLIPILPQEKLHLFHALTSMFSAIVVTAIILWFYLEFGLTVALFVFTSAFFSQWLVLFGRNLWWSMWAFYLPVVVVMYYLKFKCELMNINQSTFGAIVFITILIKCLFNGYEYITSTIVMMIVPFVYYSILNWLNFHKFLTGLFTAAFSSCLAILLSFLILCFQIARVKGSFLDGVDHIIFSFDKRSHGNSYNHPEVFASSIKSSTTYVLGMYLHGIYLRKVTYLYLIKLFAIMSCILYFSKNRYSTEKEKRKNLALIFATWFSILAPLSWFIIFKAHSYIHTHMNYIVWQMPFVFFGFAVCGLVVKSLLADLIRLIRRYHFAS